MKRHLITSILYKVGINFCVDVPPDVCDSLGGKGYIAVTAKVAGISIRTTLIPAGAVGHRLFINGEMRKAAGMEEGDLVTVLLGRDEESREIPIPRDLTAAMKNTAGAQAVFNSLTPGLRIEFLRWVINAKKPETRARRIEKGIQQIMKRSRKSREA